MRRLRPQALLAAAALACLGAAAPRAAIHLGPKAIASPQRVVTLAPSLTETVLALGAGERVVGVSRFDDAPQVKALPKIGGYSDPSVEAVLALRPDLVLCEPSPGNRGAVERMAALGTPVLAVPLGNDEEIYAALREVGAALGLAEKGAALAKETRARVEAVRAKAKTVAPVRALVVYDWDPLVVSGPGSFGDGMLFSAGATNAADAAKTPYPVFSAEARGARRASSHRRRRRRPRSAPRPAPAAARPRTGAGGGRLAQPLPSRPALRPGSGGAVRPAPPRRLG
ncbi:MAG: helical backbone metal receptor [Myxococcales bacterium]